MDLNDVSALSHFFADYYNEKPGYLAVKKRKGRKVDCVKICCDGETDRLGGQRFVAVKVHPMAPVFDVRNICGSPIATALGIPLISVTYFFLPEGSDDGWGLRTGYRINEVAALLHKTIDPDAALSELPGAFGVPKSEWLKPIGDILLVREDRRPLRVEVMEALCSFIAHELGPLFKWSRAGDPNDGLPLTKVQVLAEVVPRKWEKYLEQWMEEHSSEMTVVEGEEEEEEDDLDDEDNGWVGESTDEFSCPLAPRWDN